MAIKEIQIQPEPNDTAMHLMNGCTAALREATLSEEQRHYIVGVRDAIIFLAGIAEPMRMPAHAQKALVDLADLGRVFIKQVVENG